MYMLQCGGGLIFLKGIRDFRALRKFDVTGAYWKAAAARGCVLKAPDVNPVLAVSANRVLLLSAVANLLQNAIKFTRPGTEVVFSAYASADKIYLDTADHCGGLAPGVDGTCQGSCRIKLF